MKNQSTMSSDYNPYSTVLFTPSSVTDQVQNIIDSTLEELQEIDEKKSKKKFTYTLSNFISTFLKKNDNNDDDFNKSQTDEQDHQISSFSVTTKFDDNSTPPQRSVKLNLITPINPGSVLIRPASAPPIQRELPSAPDPSHLMKTPPERYLLPPFVWGKTSKQVSTSSDYEDIQQAPPPPVHRRRGRPRKNPLPDDYYNSHSNANILKYHSAQINIHSSASATFTNSSGNSNKNSSKKNKAVESTTSLESPPKETTEAANNKTEINSLSENTEDNSASSTNVTPIRASSSESSLKIEQPQKFRQKDSVSSSDTNNDSDFELEPDEVPIVSEDRHPKPPEVIFPDSDIDEICGSRLKNSEYLVKFKGKAYKDAEWIPKENLMKNPDYAETIQCFERYGINTQEPYFNPLFQTPERILDFKDNLYLIKWTGLGYKYSTWEVLDDLNITKSNLNSLVENFESIKNQPKIDSNFNITYQPININDQFSLDDLQNEVVDRLYNKFCNNSDANLYGTIGSILRLEISALLSVLKARHNLYGPYLLVVAPPILKLASNEISTYTNLTVLTIPDNYEEEFNYIKDNAFLFQNEIPKFNVVVVSSTTFQKFTNEFPQVNYTVAAIDTSEMAELPLPNIHTVLATMRITVKKRTGKEEVIDSQDDSTFLHSEFTIFSPMLKSQRALYQQIIRDNIDIVMTPPNKIDKSRLYEVVTKLCSLANSPACLNSQEVVFKMANPMMKKKRFEDSGKMRVLKELISYAQTQNKRLMVMCRDPVVLDTLQLYVTAYEIPYVHVGALGLKRMKLDDFSPEAKLNKNIIVLAQFGKQAINWLPLILDIIVVFDGVYNPMYYFSHAARKPRKRDCMIIRLLAEDSHEAYLASCADHYEDLPMYDIFKAAAETFMRPAREAIITNSLYLKNTRYDLLFKSLPNSFQYIFDEEKSAKISSQSSKSEGFDEKDQQSSSSSSTPALPASYSTNASRKKTNLKSISSSNSTTNFLKLPLSNSPSKTSLFPPFLKSSKKNIENRDSVDSSSAQSQSTKATEISASKSSPDISSVVHQSQSSTVKTIITKLDPSSPKSDDSSMSGDDDDIDDSNEPQQLSIVKPCPPPPPPPSSIKTPPPPPQTVPSAIPPASLSTSSNCSNNTVDNTNIIASNTDSQTKKPKSVQISPPVSSNILIPPQNTIIKQENQFPGQQVRVQINPHSQNSNSDSIGINPSSSASLIDKKISVIKSTASEPNLLHMQGKRKRILKRKIRLEPGQPCPPKPAHGTITIHHHHKRINSSLSTSNSTTTSIQLQPNPTSSSSQKDHNQPLLKASSTPLLKNPLASSDFFYKFAELPSIINPEPNLRPWTLEDLDLLLILISNHPWGQWGLIFNIMKRQYSMYSIRETSYKVLKLMLENRSEFPILSRVINDHCKSNENKNIDNCAPSNLIAEFVYKNASRKSSFRYKLTKISNMLCVALVMASSVNPPSDIFTVSLSTVSLPSSWWNPAIDDRQLINYVWQNGYSLFACQGRLWSNKTVIESRFLIQRFECLMKEIEIAILNKNSIIYPLVLKEHPVTLFSSEQVDSAFNSSVGKVINDFGFIEVDEICKLSGQISDQAISNEFALTQNINVAFISDFFERIRYELLSPAFYFAEDYQLMEAVEFHGRIHSSQSILIQSMFDFRDFPNYDFNVIINKIRSLFENKKNEPFNHSNTSFNSVGNYVPQMPFILSDKIQISKLGEISRKSGFHNEKYIYPVGYEAITTFASTFEPNKTDRYLCQIVDNGMESPIFKVTSMSKKTVFQDVMPDKVWKQVADKVSYINSMNMFESIKTPGHELFGLSFPTTIRLIQSMKGCDQCMKYRIRAFKVPFESIKH